MTDIRPPAPPELVYIGDYGVIHGITPDGACIPAAPRLTNFWSLTVLSTVRVWCDACWPGERCRYCEHPAGPGRECAGHLAWSTTTDKALERVA